MNNDNSFKTVDLREEMERKKKRKERADEQKIEQIYQPSEETKRELQRITPSSGSSSIQPMRWIIVLAAFIMVGSVVWWTASEKKEPQPEAGKEISGKTDPNLWYAVKLSSGEMFYGQVESESADPVSLNNVYYNYDMAKDDKKDVSETGSIRLVKRGKETHGPSGVMKVVRSQILFMEPLAEDSKVLKAIKDNENAIQAK